MSKFLNLVESNDPKSEGDPNDKVIEAIKKLCDTLNIPCMQSSGGLMIKNKPDATNKEEEAEDPYKMATGLSALLSTPTQKEGGIFGMGKDPTAVKINQAKQKVADAIGQMATKWVARFQ